MVSNIRLIVQNVWIMKCERESKTEREHKRTSARISGKRKRTKQSNRKIVRAK